MFVVRKMSLKNIYKVKSLLLTEKIKCSELIFTQVFTTIVVGDTQENHVWILVAS